jgi:hypothetical protein
MRTELKQLRSIRKQLETMRPESGSKKWVRIFQARRVAGVLRSVSAAKDLVLLTDLAADKDVAKADRSAARAQKKFLENCAAHRETAWLNQKQLQRFLAEYRANGYTDPAGYEWVEDRESNPYPYVNKD